MTVFTAPQQYVATPGRRAIFLAGGITGCPDWQAEAIAMIGDADVDVLNPRRPDFDITDQDAAGQQIRWEFEHLHQADVIAFWFPDSPGPQPIALYELGRYVALGLDVVVGCDARYPRRFDVVTQIGLAGEAIEVFDELEHVVANAISAAEPDAAALKKLAAPTLCSYPGCRQPVDYLPHADGGPGSGWRHIDDEVDKAANHVGYPMARGIGG